MSGGLIEASADFGALAARLIQHARTLANAHLQTRALAARNDETRWRRAGLLWPLFTKG
ncbi:hypothetical protein [Novosphingobium mangrovi (ex Huang et al. 2023)]|uniref:Uncharacterized protein n=1 Tax=Novosphingobium mangrovi (ex Huang et al. 2023) TaxID=2976432 RepID=A0ABT2I323_9SPHN|nr:hypothetical protein [Novosphingobium mangrovi (ex Huang et al. 2023)]MCT2399204.1 hypothetical protein [Novosphingobium mangrovi (ex Huang et al. 2023)]